MRSGFSIRNGKSRSALSSAIASTSFNTDRHLPSCCHSDRRTSPTVATKPERRQMPCLWYRSDSLCQSCIRHNCPNQLFDMGQRPSAVSAPSLLFNRLAEEVFALVDEYTTVGDSANEARAP